ncbi:MAG: ABC transporter ATP-binding protein, partial [Abditibacteriota bacterium]|nr:ABC transporter ATP-binding protein [Abditibacteriota bacterium]
MRLGFSIATRSEPDILLIDEVLAVGDAAFQLKCFDLISYFNNRGRTIIFVTLDLEAALRVADRTVRIGGGKILADGDSKEIIKEYLNENHAD